MSFLETFDRLPDAALVRCVDAFPLIGVRSNTTFWRRVKLGDLPAPLKLPGSHLNYYRAATIRQIQASATRDQAA